MNILKKITILILLKTDNVILIDAGRDILKVQEG